MVEVKTRGFTDATRKEAERAMDEVERRAGDARAEFGKVVLDVTDEYFPEAVRERRRRDVAAGFAGGVAAGLGAGLAVAYALRR